MRLLSMYPQAKMYLHCLPPIAADIARFLSGPRRPAYEDLYLTPGTTSIEDQNYFQPDHGYRPTWVHANLFRGQIIIMLHQS